MLKSFFKKKKPHKDMDSLVSHSMVCTTQKCFYLTEASHKHAISVFSQRVNTFKNKLILIPNLIYMQIL